MRFISGRLTVSNGCSNHCRRQTHRRTFFDSAIKSVRDRGLDHVVEKEKNLKPLLNIKNLIKSEPSKSLPITIINQKRDFLKIPFRPIDFVRKYPNIFEEFLPGGIGINPHVRLTSEVINLDAEEQLVYQSESYRREVSDRLLKLLMICRINKLPLNIIDCLKWDLGLPTDYMQTLVPEFPDYFRIVGNKDLELVCWGSDMAISVMEKKAMNCDSSYVKGMPIAFPLQFSRGFEMDKKLKKWVDDWQKLPSVSPYENSLHFLAKSDESDKWAVSVMHEILNLFVSKKAERENLLCFGEYLGCRSRFKRALLQHPGIFYLSSKIGTYTVVLRDAYKRGALIKQNRLMNMRFQYIHLMNTVKDQKAVSVPAGNTQKKKQTTKDSKAEKEGEDDDESKEDCAEDLNDLSNSDAEDASDDDYHDRDEDEIESDEDESRVFGHKNVSVNRGRRTSRTMNSDMKRRSRNPVRERSAGKQSGNNKAKVWQKVSGNTEVPREHNVRQRPSERSNYGKSRGLDKRSRT